MKIYVFLLSIMVLASSVIMLSVQNSFAQTADIVITGQGIGKKYGDFSVQNVRISEKQHYKVVTIDVHVKVKNSELQDWFVFSPIQTNLVNLKGKSYPPDPSECKIPTMYQVSGKRAQILPIHYVLALKKTSTNSKSPIGAINYIRLVKSI